MSGNQIVGFDKAIISFVQSFETLFLTSIMKFFTFVGAGNTIKVLIAIAMIILFFFFKFRSKLVLLIGVMIGSHYVFRILKLIFHRARPDLHSLIEIGGYSFPSGHATNAITFYGILLYLLWHIIPSRWGRTLLVVICTTMIVMIGVSRIYLGVHYPSDVIAGYCAGGFWLILAIWIYQLVMKKIHEGKHKSVN
ncbi:phosphatase PAP2 family protein [Paenisporosarcina indica]|uniref:phosphatase PAP2 family protein n=1 Tax=Paenisporosarcina indica TaxID=650093 RepID=UPI001FE78494|nr:phosphatase PAP2 family protein [Paenisporosarcina indica]